MANRDQGFEDFMQQRRVAAQSYVNGDAEPLGRMATHSSPASFFGPRGGHTQGASEVSATYQRDASAFERGSETRLEILSSSLDLGYWVGLQHAQVRLKGNPNPVPMVLRLVHAHPYCVSPVGGRGNESVTVA